MKSMLAAALLSLSMIATVSAKPLAGITLPESMMAGDTKLVLNGGGIRTKSMMNIYVGGLYLTAPASKASAIIAADEPMAIKLHMVSGMITSEAMEDATMEGFENTTGGDMNALAGPIDQFVSVFREPISEGDVFDIVNLPGKGIDV